MTNHHRAPFISKPKIYAIYARSAVADPEAVELQLCSCANRVLELGGELGEIYADDGTSGAKLGPDLQRLIKDAREGTFDRVVVESFDRFARSLRQRLNLFDKLKAAGIAVTTLEQTSARPSVAAFLPDDAKEALLARLEAGRMKVRARKRFPDNKQRSP